MNSVELLEQRIATVIAGSRVPEDAAHSRNTLRWLLEFAPDADAALRIAALGHDIDRAVEQRRTRREEFADFEEFKAAHARNSAEILWEMMEECGVEDGALKREVYRLVRRHEVGGDPRSELLVDADSLSFFDSNLPFYRERNSWEETRRRCVWGYRRLSQRAAPIVASLAYPSQELRRLVAESVEFVESQRGPAPAAGAVGRAREWISSDGRLLQRAPRSRERR